MKKIILLSLVAVCALNLRAQIRYGFQAGGSFANITEEYKDPTSNITETIKSSSNVGILAGFVADIPVYGKFSVRPELSFVQKNFKYNLYSWDLGSSADIDFVTNYIELPVNVVYNVPLAGGRLFFGGGPSLSWGLNGKAKADGEHIHIKFDGESNDLSDEYLHMNTFDVGVGLIAGQVFSNGLFGSIGYNWGLSNLAPDSEIETIKSKMFTVKVGYMLSGKRKVRSSAK